ncbi:hypothetical protein MPDQ_004762 [Monascus purpureus]|uniref:Uncharacterized protein n=1 Tax=Monascus purpureus TaxID=5098 RepID=A0A507R1H0_MONPU|nr:hypothetical protein MPDQ_004762 [Monascus purpureus]BDD62860.1 hypothetical protein MAP00_007816 [Monascus purpureus]
MTGCKKSGLAAEAAAPPGPGVFLQLPGKARNLIYTCLFTSTRLSVGERSTSRVLTKIGEPAPNSLAILRTRSDQPRSWRSLAWSRFVQLRNPEDLLDKLSALPSTTAVGCLAE